MWPLVLSYTLERGWTEFQLSMTLTLGWHYLWLIVANIQLYFIYHLEHPFFERYKVNTLQWPWNENREEWNILLKKSLRTVAFNSFVMVPITILSTLMNDKFEVSYDFSVEGLPDWKTFAANITFCMLCEDVGFHFMHRLLHLKAIYPYIHK